MKSSVVLIAAASFIIQVSHKKPGNMNTYKHTSKSWPRELKENSDIISLETVFKNKFTEP